MITTDQNSIASSRLNDILNAPQEGEFDNIARLAAEVLNVPFVLISLVHTGKQKTKTLANLNGANHFAASDMTESNVSVSVSSRAYLTEDLIHKHPDVIKEALADNDELDFRATAPLVTESGDHLGTLYAFDRDGRLWGNVHWEILDVIAGIIVGQLEVKLAAQSIIRAQQEMAYVMSHDIRGAVCNIPVLVKMIRDENGDPEKQKALGNMIIKASEKSLQTVDQFYANSQIVSAANSEKSEMNFSEVTRKTITAHRPLAARKQITINMLIEPNIHLTGSKKNIIKLLDNLLSNAIKYSLDGQIIDVILVKSKDFIILEVRDEGVGMSRSDINNAFTRFDTFSSKSGEGDNIAGLGLWVVNEIAREHEGKVTLKSRGKGKGTTFTVMLPNVPESQNNRTSKKPLTRRILSGEYAKNGVQVSNKHINPQL